MTVSTDTIATTTNKPPKIKQYLHPKPNKSNLYFIPIKKVNLF